MKKKILNTLKITAFISIGIVLFILVYYDQVGVTLSDSTIESLKTENTPPEVINKLEKIKDNSYFSDEKLDKALAGILTHDEFVTWKPLIHKYKIKKFENFKAAMKDVNYIWLLPAILIGILSHIARAIRWRLLIFPLGYKPRKINMFFSIMIMYIANLTIPRSGEVARCGVVTQYEKIPFPKLFGTVVVERIIDLLSLLVLTIVILITEMGVVRKFLNNNPDIKSNLGNIANSAPLLIGIGIAGIAGLILLYVFRHKFRNNFIYKKISGILKSFLEGIKTVMNLDRKWQFLFYTFVIWACYFGMVYICFLCLDFTSHLSLMTALTLLCLSSFGMVVPSPGGVGAWHFLAFQTLFVYGIAIDQGKIYALITHSAQTIILVVLGILSVILLPIFNRENENSKKSTTD